MILYTHSNASYLLAANARGCAGGQFFLSQQIPNANKATVGHLRLNGPIYTTCQIIYNVMASAAKADIGVLFLNGQDVLPCKSPLKSHAIPNHSHQCKQTTPLPPALQMTQSSKNNTRKWI
jgi:hypothetical protein